MFHKLLVWLLILFSLVLTACTGTAAAQSAAVVTPLPTEESPAVKPTLTQTSSQEKLIPDTGSKETETTPEVTHTMQQEASPTAVTTVLPPEEWQEWPTTPVVSERARQIYRIGLLKGNDPGVFSVFGDCQSKPGEFWGIYDSEDFELSASDKYLLDTIENFSGSFSRPSPTVKDGTTAGALLWDGWVDPRFKECNYGESPIDCELRVNKPSIVLISLGTHWETRNEKYLRTIIERVIAHGAVPVLSTKADNREGDDRLNLEMARVAVEEDIPLWNFWRAAQELPNGGLVDNRKDIFNNVYLTEEGLDLHRIAGLEMLDSVYEQLNSSE